MQLLRKHAQRVSIILWSTLLIGLAPVVHAADYDTQINALNQQIKNNQSAASQKASEASTLQSKVAQLNAEIGAAQAALGLTRTTLAKTQAEIEAQTVELAKQTDNLRENLKAMYKDRDITPLEILASSENLSDFVGKQQYMTDIKQKIQSNIAAVNDLKAQLEVKKTSLITQAENEKGQLAQVSAKQAEQASLLTQTKGQEAAYQSIVAQNKTQLTAVFAARAEEIRRAQQSGGSYQNGGACGGGYPAKWCRVAQDSTVDDWGYYNRECVSYVAWKRSSIGRWVPTWWGNAGDWYGRASSGITPQYGDVVVWPYSRPNMPYGHVAIVESNNGSSITISEYNYGVQGTYSVRTIPNGSLGGVRYLR